jgi:gamma-butyrobetaine dioxygenase
MLAATVAPARASSTAPMSDLESMSTPHRIVTVAHDPQGVTLDWSDGLRSRCHVLWLRDNCPCPACRHPQALERTYMFVDHGLPRVASATLAVDGWLEVRFESAADGSHATRFSAAWLRRHDPADAESRAQRYVPLPWDASIAARLPTVRYDDYMQTPAGLRRWIEALKTHGIVLLRGVPQVPGTLLQVARRIGPVRGSNFGEHYDVVSMPNPNASAYTAMGLELHTDLANWRNPPDVQLLCCLKSSVRGGESVFADGLKVAEDLRREEPAMFEVLAHQPLGFRFHDASCDIRATGPAIELDAGGRFRRVRFNNWLRGALVAPPEVVEATYAALGALWRRLRDPANRLDLRLEPGDLIAYDNNRVLHGRAPFDPTTGERHLQGCYLNQEDVDSMLRVLDRVAS